MNPMLDRSLLIKVASTDIDEATLADYRKNYGGGEKLFMNPAQIKAYVRNKKSQAAKMQQMEALKNKFSSGTMSYTDILNAKQEYMKLAKQVGTLHQQSKTFEGRRSNFAKGGKDWQERAQAAAQGQQKLRSVGGLKGKTNADVALAKFQQNNPDQYLTDAYGTALQQNKDNLIRLQEKANRARKAFKVASVIPETYRGKDRKAAEERMRLAERDYIRANRAVAAANKNIKKLEGEQAARKGSGLKEDVLEKHRAYKEHMFNVYGKAFQNAIPENLRHEGAVIDKDTREAAEKAGAAAVRAATEKDYSDAPWWGLFETDRAKGQEAYAKYLQAGGLKKRMKIKDPKLATSFNTTMLNIGLDQHKVRDPKTGKMVPMRQMYDKAKKHAGGTALDRSGWGRFGEAWSELAAWTASDEDLQGYAQLPMYHARHMYAKQGGQKKFNEGYADKTKDAVKTYKAARADKIKGFAKKYAPWLIAGALGLGAIGLMRGGGNQQQQQGDGQQGQQNPNDWAKESNFGRRGMRPRRAQATGNPLSTAFTNFMKGGFGR